MNGIKRKLIKVLGFVLMVLPFVFIFFIKNRFLREEVLNYKVESGYDILILFIVVLALMKVTYIGFKLIVKIQKKEVKSSKKIIKQRKEKPVLFIKSSLSNSKPKLVSTNNLAYLLIDEQKIISSLNFLGPSLVIGNPIDQEAIFLGAPKIYIEDEKWKTKFFNYLNNSSYAVISINSTKGILWGLHQIFSYKKPDRIIIYIPWKKVSLKERERLWKHFKNLFLHFYPEHKNRLPAKINNVKFIVYEKNWSIIKFEPKRKLITKILLLGNNIDLDYCIVQLQKHLGFKSKTQKLVIVWLIFMLALVWSFSIFMLYAMMASSFIFGITSIIIIVIIMYYLSRNH